MFSTFPVLAGFSHATVIAVVFSVIGVVVIMLARLILAGVLGKARDHEGAGGEGR